MRIRVVATLTFSNASYARELPGLKLHLSAGN